MEEDQIISRIALILAIIAFIGVLGIGCYVYFEPEIDFDFNDVGDAIDSKVDLIKIKIDNIVEDIKDLKDKNLDMDEYLEVDDFEDELENLEEMIEDNEDDINDNEDDIDEIVDCIKNNNNITAIQNCLNS